MNVGIKNYLEVRAGATIRISADVNGTPEPEVCNLLYELNPSYTKQNLDKLDYSFNAIYCLM